MKSFVAVLALVALAAADVSHIVRSTEADAQIVQQDSDVAPDGFKYIYETSNGISASESGSLVGNGKDDASISVQGGNSYTAPDGSRIETRYVADATGYHPEGAHLPTTPAPQPIPDYIIRALQYIEAHPPAPEPIRRN